MLPPLLPVVVAGLATTAAATPLARRLALHTGFLDQPAEDRWHGQATPYLGGLAIVAGVLAGLVTGPPLGTRGGVVVLGACVTAALGLVDDRHGIRLHARLAVQGLVATATVVAGITAHVTGWWPADAMITLVWIVGVGNALNLLDNMDGLASGTATTVSAAVVALAVGLGQPTVAAVAAALGAACLGFLPYNSRHASIFMGDAGSLVLGYLLAVLTLAVDPVGGLATRLAVPVLLLAVPLADTATVALTRLADGRPLCRGGRDHLSHRLVVRGATPPQAVAGLVTAQAVAAAAAVLTGTGAGPVLLAVAIGVVPLAALMVPALQAEAPDRGAGPARRLSPWIGGIAVLGVLTTTIIGVLLAADAGYVVTTAMDGSAGSTGSAGDPLGGPGTGTTALLPLVAAGLTAMGVTLWLLLRRGRPAP